MKTLATSLKSLEITGLPKQDRPQQSLIGTQRGGTGFLTPLSESQAAELLAMPPEKDMAPLTPRQTAEAWLQPTTGSSLGEKTRDRFDEKHGYDFDFIDYEWRAGSAIPDIDDDIRNLEIGCRPLPDQAAAKLLIKLWSKTAKRKEVGFDLDLILESYCEEFPAYPGDVVAYVLKTQASVNKFFPVWNELESRLELYGRNRLKLLDFLRKSKDNMGM